MSGHVYESQNAAEGPADPRRDYFERLAPHWDQKGQDPVGTVARMEDLKDMLAFQPGQDVLEVGCGTGQITGWLHGVVQPGKVVGIDFASTMVRLARQKHPRLDFHVLDICSRSPVESCCDVALCFHSFPHFRDQLAALKNLRRALRPTGRLIVMHLAGSSRINAMHTHFGGVVGHDHLPSDAGWADLLARSGFHQTNLIDREDLFCLQAMPAASGGANSRTHV